MKTLCEVTDVCDLTGQGRKKDKIDVSFHIHIPYIIQCCDVKQSNQFARS
jgi:hypothetical protein